MSDPAGLTMAGAYAIRSGAPCFSTQDTRLRGPSRHRPKGSYMTVGISAALEIQWTAVCPYARLTPDRGVAALVGGAQVAIFRTSEGAVYAVGHRDPVSGAHVMSRGIVASRDGVPTIASPSLRHVYDLHTGECLDLPGIRVPVYPVRCREGVVEIGLMTAANQGRAG
jgi:nitrite reductase (NADH) small subunit